MAPTILRRGVFIFNSLAWLETETSEENNNNKKNNSLSPCYQMYFSAKPITAPDAPFTCSFLCVLI